MDCSECGGVEWTLMFGWDGAMAAGAFGKRYEDSVAAGLAELVPRRRMEILISIFIRSFEGNF